MCATTSTSVAVSSAPVSLDERARDRRPGAPRAGPGSASSSIKPRPAYESSNARVRTAPRPCAASARLQRGEVVGRVHVQPERLDVRDLRLACPPRARAREWRSNDPSPNAGAITSGGASRSAFVPVPVAVGDDHDRRGAREQRARPRPDRAPGSRRARAARAPRRARRRGDRRLPRRRGAPARPARRPPARGRVGLATLAGSCTTWTRVRRDPRGDRLGGHDDHAVQRGHGGERVEHVGDHRGGEGGAVRERLGRAAAWRGRRT